MPGDCRAHLFFCPKCLEFPSWLPFLLEVATSRTVKQTVRLSSDEQAQMQRVAKERGYLSPTAFIRVAMRNELTGRENELTESEQRTAATLERLSRDIFRTNRVQQALFAVVDTLVKTFLTCVPEPPRDGMSQSSLGREIVMTGS